MFSIILNLKSPDWHNQAVILIN